MKFCTFSINTNVGLKTKALRDHPFVVKCWIFRIKVVIIVTCIHRLVANIIIRAHIPALSRIRATSIRIRTTRTRVRCVKTRIHDTPSWKLGGFFLVGRSLLRDAA